MTDNGIKKALKDLLDRIGRLPDGIYFDGKKSTELELLITDTYLLINHQKAKIDRLDIELKAMRGAANSYKAEMERLTDVLNATIAGQETLQRYMSTAKAEAVKEFANRLKEKATATHKSLDGKYLYEIDNDFIDSLVKEMEGEE